VVLLAQPPSLAHDPLQGPQACVGMPVRSELNDRGAIALHRLCDAFGNGGRFQTCLLLDGGPERLMLDCGASSLTALKAAGVEPNDVGAVLITLCTAITSTARASVTSVRAPHQRASCMSFRARRSVWRR
jgi:hypothetical protein